MMDVDRGDGDDDGAVAETNEAHGIGLATLALTFAGRMEWYRFSTRVVASASQVKEPRMRTKRPGASDADDGDGDVSDKGPSTALRVETRR